MFTGIVEAHCPVDLVLNQPPGKRLVVNLGIHANGLQIGDSVAINGCCLTVVQRTATAAEFEAGPETLRRTTLGKLVAGGMVNIERSLRVGDRLGGHFVTGHVDAVGQLVERSDEQDWSTYWFQMPARLAVQMAGKGSVAVDGVSLTLVEVESERFSVALIPHTLQQTTLGDLQVGDEANLETDLLAKYVEKQLQGNR